MYFLLVTVPIIIATICVYYRVVTWRNLHERKGDKTPIQIDTRVILFAICWVAFILTWAAAEVKILNAVGIRN